MTMVAPLKIKGFELNNIEVIGISDRYEKRFVLKSGDRESKDFVFKDILKKTKDLARELKERQPDQLTNLGQLQTFITKLKHANNEVSQERSRWYHHLIDFGVQSAKLDKLENKIQDRMRACQNDEIKVDNAIRSKDVNAIKQLAKAGIDFNVRWSDGHTPLCHAACQGFSEVVKALIEAFADVNLPNLSGKTPLFFALKYTDIAELLFLKHANPNIQDKEGMTVAHHAVTLRDKEALKMLIDNKVNLNIQDKDGLTVAYYAVALGDVDALRLLIDAKADLNIKDNQGGTVVHYAVLLKDKEILKVLLEVHANLNVLFKGETPIHLALRFRDIEALKILVENHADLSIRNDDGITAFSLAKELGLTTMSKIMKAALTFDEIARQEEMLKVRLLANSINLSGNATVKFHKDLGSATQVDLEGFHNYYLIKTLNKGTKTYAPNLESDEASLLLELFSTINHSKQSKLQQIKEGFPVCFSTGLTEHSVMVLVWGPYFILCNRGLASRKTIEVYTHDWNSWNEDHLIKINKSVFESKESYQALFFDELPNVLNFQSNSFTKSLENLCGESLDTQTVGNCAWASTEAAVFSFFALSTLLESVDDFCLTEPRAVAIQKKFFFWLSFMQMYNLERYLGTHIMRSYENVEKVKLHVRKRSSTVIDQAVVQAAKDAILANAKKAGVQDEFYPVLEQLLRGVDG